MFKFVNLHSLAALLLAAGLAFGVWGFQSRLPDIGELQSHTLTVSAVGTLGQIGPVLLLADPKPAALIQFWWERPEAMLDPLTGKMRERLVAIPCPHDLGLSDAQLMAMNAHAPARMRIETWDGLAVGVSLPNGETLLSVQTSRERIAKKQQFRLAIAAACLLAALAAFAGAWKLKPHAETPGKTDSFHQSGEPQ
jgi:hypothetical protein